ncbi:hypothetical protein MASR1M45_03690 [Candidatus Kapaibacterium sp.]
MKNNEIASLLKKADELRALFILGQKVIPFLEEIFIFVSDIQPLLDEINRSITENLKRMPSASQQLSKVTEATELATTEIMDLVDGILFNVDTLESNFTRLNKLVDLQSEKTLETLRTLYDAIEAGVDAKDLLPELKNIIDCFDNKIILEKDETINNSKEILKTIQNDSTSIMMSLQVQDITSQQIAAVNKLLETLQTRLSGILTHFKESDLNEMISAEVEAESTDYIRVSKLHREIAFDPHAVDSIANKGFKQNEVDQYIKIHKENLAENDDFQSQDDIDKFFRQQNDDNQESPSVVNDNSSEAESTEFENQSEIDNNSYNNDDLVTNLSNAQASSDDISNLLDNMDMDEPFSQEDIDKMFK